MSWNYKSHHVQESRFQNGQVQNLFLHFSLQNCKTSYKALILRRLSTGDLEFTHVFLSKFFRLGKQLTKLFHQELLNVSMFKKLTKENEVKT